MNSREKANSENLLKIKAYFCMHVLVLPRNYGTPSPVISVHAAVRGVQG